MPKNLTKNLTLIKIKITLCKNKKGILMDDDEYYEKMRAHNLNKTKTKISSKKSNYSEWNVTQGHEDAEMLMEKNFPDSASAYKKEFDEDS